MKNFFKTLIIGALSLSFVFSASIPSKAACESWVYNGASTYCSTPLCSTADIIPSQYVSKKYYRWCIDKYGNKTQETKTELDTAGCC